MSFVAVTIEGGLLAADLLDRLGAAPDGVEGQRGHDFGYFGPRLTEEIQAAFADLKSYWTTFQTRRQRGSENLTTLTRQVWVSQLLGRLRYDLDFQRSAAEAGGVRYAISHRAADEMVTLPVHVVSWQQKLGERTEDGKISPQALVQEYLNRSDALWGIVTNGRRLRLLRDSALITRPSYVEFDLEAMLDGNLYNEFVLFYRLIHRTRLPERMGEHHRCLIERYYQQGIEEGGRVRERLREGVEEALRILGTGFLGNPASQGLRDALHEGRLDPLSFYRELLRLIYRILFLMVAEERRLLFPGGPAAATRRAVYDRWYGVTALRERADRRVPRDPHGDLWVGLTQTFRLFREAEAAGAFGLGVLNGELFGQRSCAHLETQAGIANDVLLKAIHALSTFEEDAGRGRRGVRRRVHYGGLDVEELGSIYESLLDFHPRVSLDPAEFDLIPGSERKSTGSYYTPPALVRELIDSALVPAIERRLAAAGPGRDAREAALLSMTVCDPAAGSGHFVLAAARRIGRALAQVRGEDREPSPEDYRLAVRDVIRNCIYAVDRNQLAVDLCKVALWIEGHCAGLPLSFLDHRVRWGDSLVGVFDLAVLGDGVPDGAYKTLGGDDADVARRVKKLNRVERDERDLFVFDAEQAQETLSARFGAVAAVRDDTADAVHDKQRQYNEIRGGDPDWLRLRTACDLWSAAFFAPLTGETERRVPTTRHVREALLGQGAGRGKAPEAVAGTAKALARDLRFFHWPLEFPEVFKAGGFTVVLGNPPWERIKLQEQEFFAVRDPEIARARNKAERALLIARLYAPEAPEAKRKLGREFDAAKREADGASLFIRESGRFPLTATGDMNTYALFAEMFFRSRQEEGKVGIIVPTGIATDDTTKAFFGYIVESRLLVSLIGFREIRQIFHGTDDRSPFCLLTLGAQTGESEFAFSLPSAEDLSDPRRRFTMTAEDIARINPNTRNAPVFRTRADADLVRGIYERVPVLIAELEDADVE